MKDDILQKYSNLGEAYTVLKKNVSCASPLVLGCSGGVDSIVLATLLYHWGYTKVHLVYIDHGLRSPQDRKKDSDLVGQLAKVYGYTFQREEVNTQEYMKRYRCSFEEAGRHLRYQTLEEIRSEKNAEWVFTAHHQDDDIETFIFNLLRGSGPRGLKGMETIDYARYLVRPLLTVPKQTLYDVAQDLHLVWQEDHTNMDEKYSRNRIRKKVIPALEAYNPSVKNQILLQMKKQRGLFQSMQEMLSGMLGAQWQDNSVFIYDDVATLPLFLREEFFHTLIIKHEGEKGLFSSHIEKLAVAVERLQTGKRLQLGADWYMRRQHDHVLLEKKDPKKIHIIDDMPLVMGKLPPFAERSYMIGQQQLPGSISLPYESLREDMLVLRHRHPGDWVMRKKGKSTYRKSLKTILMEMKVDTDMKKHIPVVAIKNTSQILALPTLGISWYDGDNPVYLSLVAS